MPEPFEPSTATRSPKNTSRSNGRISPVSSSCSQVTARRPVRPPRSRILIFCSFGRSSGGPAFSNRSSRVTAACSRLAMSELYAAFCRYMITSALSLACSSSHRRRSSSRRSWRSSRASWYVANPPPCTHAEPASTVTIRLAVRASSSRSCDTSSTVFGDSSNRSSSHRLPGTSRKLSGSSSSSTSSGPRSSASRASRFCSPPDSVAHRGAAPGRTGCRVRRPCRCPRAPRRRSRRHRPSRPAPGRSAAGWARRRCPSSPARPCPARLPPTAPAPARARRAGRARRSAAAPRPRPARLTADELPHHAEAAATGRPCRPAARRRRR